MMMHRARIDKNARHAAPPIAASMMDLLSVMMTVGAALDLSLMVWEQSATKRRKPVRKHAHARTRLRKCAYTHTERGRERGGVGVAVIYDHTHTRKHTQLLERFSAHTHRFLGMMATRTEDHAEWGCEWNSCHHDKAIARM